MTDEQLTALAAKAIGAEVFEGVIKNRKLNGVYLCYAPTCKGRLVHWTPLHDNSDAFMLATQLKAIINIDEEVTTIGPCEVNIYEMHNGDSAKATRRAIVRFAAEVGRIISDIGASP